MGPMPWLIVALGSAIGGVLRYAVSRAMPAQSGSWPVATLSVNLTGSLLIGALAAWFASRSASIPADVNLRLFAMTGVLGGFTTYSAFALETTLLGGSGMALRALLYVVVTVLGCLLAAILGRTIATALLA